tara:strand:+ start:5757 stop:6398 length:642 start_codon:yes stop_codon:yes gene_type:complete
MDKLLKEGFKNFKNNYYKDYKSDIIKLVKDGQKPKFIVISCSDSRVDPAILFQTKPGDIFSIRNIANIVPPYSPNKEYHGVGAAIEFGVLDLKIKNIIVLGHSHCGGMNALKNKMIKDDLKYKNEKREFLDSWINIASPIMSMIDPKKNSKPIQHLIEKESIKNSLNNLKTFPWLQKLINDKKLNIYGWWYDIEKAKLLSFDENKNTFINLEI